MEQGNGMDFPNSPPTGRRGLAFGIFFGEMWKRMLEHVTNSPLQEMYHVLNTHIW